MGLRIPDEVLFLESLRPILQGGSTCVDEGRDALLFPEIACSTGEVEDDEAFEGPTTTSVIDETPYPDFAPR